MIFYLLLTLFALRSLQLLAKGRLVNTLGVNLSDPAYDSGSESAPYMITTDSAGNTVQDGNGAELSSSIRGLSGVTMADMWRLTSNFTGSQVISSNLEQVDTNGFQNIGSAMSHSSGVWTFPTTGVYKVEFHLRLYDGAQAKSAMTARIGVTTDDGTNWANATEATESASYVDSSDTYAYIGANTIIGITDTSTHKIRFETAMGGTPTVRGGTDTNETYMVFIRLGDL